MYRQQNTKMFKQKTIWNFNSFFVIQVEQFHEEMIEYKFKWYDMGFNKPKRVSF